MRAWAVVASLLLLCDIAAHLLVLGNKAEPKKADPQVITEDQRLWFTLPEEKPSVVQPKLPAKVKKGPLPPQWLVEAWRGEWKSFYATPASDCNGRDSCSRRLTGVI